MAQNKLSTAVLRKRNRNNIYRFFYESEKPCTKQELAAALTLSLPTVTQNLRELLDEGLIEYAGLIDSSGGRRPRAMRLCARARFAVGVDLSPKHIRLVAVDLLANVIAYEKHAIAFSNDVTYRKRMAQVVEGFLDRFSLDREKMLGIGITLPGIINEEQDLIEVIPVFGVRKMRLSLLTELLPYPVVVMNDANAGGFAEWWNHDTMETMAYLFVGKGVGGAILMEGKPYVGNNRRSAEFGHMRIADKGKPCSCGKTDCLEAYCSTTRLSDDLDIQTEEFFERLRDGDAQCDRIWKEYLDALATGINNIRMAMDCPIVLGGIITSYFEQYLPDLRMRLKMKNCFEDDASYLHLGRCGDQANSIGAALHFISKFIQQV